MPSRRSFLLGGLLPAGLVCGFSFARGAEGPPGLGPYSPYGLDLAGTDRDVRPGDDFFRFGNGGWLARTPIPPDRAFVGIDQGLEDIAQEHLRTILDAVDWTGGTAGPPGSDLAKARDLYRSYLDEAYVERLGAAPLSAHLAAIRAAGTRHELAALMGRSQGEFGGSLFDLSIRADPKAPQRYAVTVRQAGLGLPDRAFYREAGFREVREAYRAYMASLLVLAGWDAPEATAAAVLAFETAVAEASWPAADARDVESTYNPLKVDDLVADGSFPWRSFLETARLGSAQTLILGQPTAIAAIADLFARASVTTLQAWLAVHLVDDAAPYLPRAFLEAHQAFRSGILEGSSEALPRWRRGIALVDALMGEAVGRAYVEAAVPAGTKPAVEAMIELLREAFADRIERLAWMSAETKGRAREKLARMGRKVAYPDEWRDYAGVVTAPDDLLGNVRSARAAAWGRRADRLYEPVARNEWFMTPQTADAAYSTSLNEMVLPAAELQAPFFHPAADPAVNFGAIGAIIGHEMTHGFDDGGRKFDAAGQLSDWWTLEDSRTFDREAGRLAGQLDRTEVLPGATIDGRLTLGEAIADLGGASIALDAYRRQLGGRPAPILDGLTGEQRFFLSYAQAWRWKAREAALRRRLASDPHPPPEARVNGTVRNMDAWYEAFDVIPGDALYLPPEARIRLW